MSDPSQTLVTQPRIDFWAEHARALGQLPPEWNWYHVERLPTHGPCQVILVRGAVAPAVERGKRKGQPNWKARDKKTERDIYITPQQHEEFLAKWERENGKCWYCQGTKQELMRWSVETGCEYRDCSRCKATGTPP